MKNQNLKSKIKYVFAAIALAGLILALPGIGRAVEPTLKVTIEAVGAVKIALQAYNLFSSDDIPISITAEAEIKDNKAICPDAIKNWLGSAYTDTATCAVWNEYFSNIQESGGKYTATIAGTATELPFDKTYSGGGVDLFKIHAEVAAGAGGSSGEFKNPLQADTFQKLVERLINFAFVVSLVLAPLMVLIAGLVWLTAGGRPDAITRGRNILYWTLIGFTIVLLARGLIAVLKSILGG